MCIEPPIRLGAGKAGNINIKNVTLPKKPNNIYVHKTGCVYNLVFWGSYISQHGGECNLAYWEYSPHLLTRIGKQYKIILI